jgi:molybdopterin synthase catalytic subunit
MEIYVKVLYFAAAREARGVREERVTLPPGSTTEELVKALELACPALKPVLRTSVLAINEVYLEGTAPQALKSGDEVAVIPPISGG